eukprot:TRINITY_DN3082_c0_g1_i2.p1 TRINITY_DN3082_c0_g1~~TRINITY_DN3082_c0_g1_i2.p1  ORF type:complete len:609 (-),score=147.33 TRINITY_DN3082_c0_g1_i2:31-1833(-)
MEEPSLSINDSWGLILKGLTRDEHNLLKCLDNPGPSQLFRDQEEKLKQLFLNQQNRVALAAVARYSKNLLARCRLPETIPDLCKDICINLKSKELSPSDFYIEKNVFQILISGIIENMTDGQMRIAVIERILWMFLRTDGEEDNNPDTLYLPTAATEYPKLLPCLKKLVITILSQPEFKRIILRAIPEFNVYRPRPKIYYLNSGLFLGEGSFARVYKGINLETGEELAFKIIDLSKYRAEEAKEIRMKTDQEVTNMRKVASEYTVCAYDSFTHPDGDSKLVIVLEFCDGGDLKGYLERQKNNMVPEEEVRKKIVIDLQHIMQNIRSRNIIHRDLKPANLVLCSKKNNGKEFKRDSLHSYVIKLADFGAARSLNPLDSAKTFTGTPLYLAPEVWSVDESRRRKKAIAGYDGRADCFSIGVIIFECLNGVKPFNGRTFEEQSRLVKEGNYKWKVNVGSEMKDLVAALLQPKASARMSEDSFINWRGNQLETAVHDLTKQNEALKSVNQAQKDQIGALQKRLEEMSLQVEQREKEMNELKKKVAEEELHRKKAEAEATIYARNFAKEQIRADKVAEEYKNLEALFNEMCAAERKEKDMSPSLQ